LKNVFALRPTLKPPAASRRPGPRDIVGHGPGADWLRQAVGARQGRVMARGAGGVEATAQGLAEEEQLAELGERVADRRQHPRAGGVAGLIQAGQERPQQLVADRLDLRGRRGALGALERADEAREVDREGLGTHVAQAQGRTRPIVEDGVPGGRKAHVGGAEGAAEARARRAKQRDREARRPGSVVGVPHEPCGRAVGVVREVREGHDVAGRRPFRK
jgi:hypothetical protein